MNIPLIVYHGGCLDGIAAAWVTNEAIEGDTEVVPGIYQKEPNFDFRDRDVFIVDFSYKLPVMANIIGAARSVTWIDHHKSAYEELAPLLDRQPMTFRYNFDLHKCGATACWEYFFHYKPVPFALKLIEDRDLWKWEFDSTRAFTTRAYADGISMITMENIMRKDTLSLKEYISEGQLLVNVHMEEVRRLIKISKRTFKIGAFEIDIVNAPPKYSSDIGNELAKENTFGCTYYDTEDGRIFSLRSVGAFDVSNVAKLYGGGGHRNAAGFSVPRHHEFAMR